MHRTVDVIGSGRTSLEHRNPFRGHLLVHLARPISTSHSPTHVWQRGVLTSSCWPTSTAHGTACFINVKGKRRESPDGWQHTGRGGTTSRSGRKLGKLRFHRKQSTCRCGLQASLAPQLPDWAIVAFACRRYFHPRRLLLSASLRFIGGVPIKPSNCQLQQGWSKRVPPEV